MATEGGRSKSRKKVVGPITVEEDENDVQADVVVIKVLGNT